MTRRASALKRKVVVNDTMQKNYVYYRTGFVGGGPSRGMSRQSAKTANPLECRRKQRQALLHWAYDSRAI